LRGKSRKEGGRTIFVASRQGLALSKSEGGKGDELLSPVHIPEGGDLIPFFLERASEKERRGRGGAPPEGEKSLEAIFACTFWDPEEIL